MTLVASLLTMGISTVVIGLLPGYESIGNPGSDAAGAGALLVRGLALAVNGAAQPCWPPRTPPPRKRALYGSFPQLGAPIGFSSLTAPSCCSPGC
nr:inner membrane metabolite transport protein YhjE [Raoultella sp. NCTC 9187]